MVVNTLFLIIGLFTNVFQKTANNTVGSLLMSLYSVAGIVNIAFIIEYVNLLKERKCQCSESIYRDIMYISAIIDALILGLSFTLLMYIMFFTHSGDVTVKKKALKKKTLRKKTKR